MPIITTIRAIFSSTISSSPQTDRHLLLAVTESVDSSQPGLLNLRQPARPLLQVLSRKACRWLAEQGSAQMASIVRIAVPAGALFASGWLLRDPASVPLW